jgi:hypothetical protein
MTWKNRPGAELLDAVLNTPDPDRKQIGSGGGRLPTHG